MKTIEFMSRIPEYAWLSNFEECPVTDLHGMVWPSAEHCYQAAKTKDPSYRDAVLDCTSAVIAKRFGATIKPRPDWDKIKVEVMRRILVAKFTQNPKFYSLLLNTEGCQLVHYAPWDGFWGTGKWGRGEDIMGKLLTEMRDAWFKSPPARPVSLKEEPNAEYIGRAGHGQDGYFGNPYHVGSKCQRCGEHHRDGGSTLPCFSAYFWDRIKNDADYKDFLLIQLTGKPLGCFCKSKSGVGNPCHGDIISLWLNNYGAVVQGESDDG